MNRTELISKLKELNPTEGEWMFNPDYYSIRSYIDFGKSIPIATTYSDQDSTLITLAPAMRKALLDMEEEMKELIHKIDKFKRIAGLSGSEKGLCRICGGDNCDSDSHK